MSQTNNTMFNNQVKVPRLASFKQRFLQRKLIRKDILHPKDRPLRILVIGSGHRIRDNFRYALQHLAFEHTVIGVYSRNDSHAQEVSRLTHWPVVQYLDADILEQADVILMSITAKAVPSIIKHIEKQIDVANKVLVVDTPVVSGMRQMLSQRLFKAFKHVVVCEDFMNFPQFELMRQFVQQGRIGQVRKIVLEHIGYLYHGLALARSFCDFASVKKVRKLPGHGFAVTLANGVEIEIQGEYRQLNGRMLIQGTAGHLNYVHSDNEIEFCLHKRDSNNFVTECWRDGHIVGLMSKVHNEIEVHEVEHFQQLNAHLSEFMSFKTHGLIQVLNSICHYNLNNEYTFIQGLYDNYVSHLANSSKGKLVADYRMLYKLMDAYNLI